MIPDYDSPIRDHDWAIPDYDFAISDYDSTTREYGTTTADYDSPFVYFDHLVTVYSVEGASYARMTLPLWVVHTFHSQFCDVR
jgi:hypothetical protein